MAISSMGFVSYAKRMMDCLCCIPPKEEEDKKRQPQKGEKKKSLTEENKKAPSTSRRRKSKRCRCWRRKKGKANNLASLVDTMSFRSQSCRHRSAAAEILRLGSRKTKNAAHVFTFRELAAATRNFDTENLLGQGGFGRVYKGQLKGTSEIVAVKQLDRNGFQGNREFLVEALMLSHLHHPNLVKLVGYCADGDQRILVYEYMPLGSLEDHLLKLSPNTKPLDWHTRMKIAAGAARGLQYLHETAKPPVIYRDFKAANVLLDKDYNPKLCDFGLAKVGPVGDDKNHVSTRVMGTYGYCAPEYALTGHLTKMSDVYSFGVVFLEMITGRRAIDTTRPTNEQHLVNWAEPLFKDKSMFVKMADPLLGDNYPMKGLHQALAVAAMCLQEEANIRPLIRDVVTALEHLANPMNDATDVDGTEESFTQSVLTSSSQKIPRKTPIPSSEIVQDDGEAKEDLLELNRCQESYSFSSREHELGESDTA